MIPFLTRLLLPLQMLCKVWGVGMFSIVALTTSNILLTLRLMQGRDDGAGGGGCGGIPPIPDNVPHSWTAALSSTNHSEYLAFLRAAAINTAPAAPTTKGSPAGEAARAGAEKSSPPLVVVGSGFQVDEARGRWDARRRYKTHDHVFTGPHYGRLTRSSPVCLATQTSVDRLFWLTQVRRDGGDKRLCASAVFFFTGGKTYFSYHLVLRDAFSPFDMSGTSTAL